MILYAYVCVCAFSFHRESPGMILGDKPLIFQGDSVTISTRQTRQGVRQASPSRYTRPTCRCILICHAPTLVAALGAATGQPHCSLADKRHADKPCCGRRSLLRMLNRPPAQTSPRLPCACATSHRHGASQTCAPYDPDRLLPPLKSRGFKRLLPLVQTLPSSCISSSTVSRQRLSPVFPLCGHR
jgi:hypothetical protein